MFNFLEYISNLQENILTNIPLYHGSNSQEITGSLRANERDSGWFGQGFYLTAYMDYAKRWGQYVYQAKITPGKIAEIIVRGNYQSVEYLGDAETANTQAGGKVGWMTNELQYSKTFSQTLANLGYIGVTCHFDNNKNVEIVVFNPQNVTIMGRIN